MGVRSAKNETWAAEKEVACFAANNSGSIGAREKIFVHVLHPNIQLDWPNAAILCPGRTTVRRHPENSLGACTMVILYTKLSGSKNITHQQPHLPGNWVDLNEYGTIGKPYSRALERAITLCIPPAPNGAILGVLFRTGGHDWLPKKRMFHDQGQFLAPSPNVSEKCTSGALNRRMRADLNWNAKYSKFKLQNCRWL